MTSIDASVVRNWGGGSSLAWRVPLTAFEPGGFKPGRQQDPLLAKARIRCPKCQWQPERRSRWFCMPMGTPEFFTGGCGHSWNTFDTRARCPGCTYQWVHTTCLNCHAASPHDDWYQQGAGP